MTMLDGISDSRQWRTYREIQDLRTKDDIWDEEDSACDVVLVAGKTDVFVHTLDLRVADVSSIDVTEQIQDSDHGYEPKVDLCC